MNQEFYNIVDDITEKDQRYREDAYAFVMEALNYTQKRFKRVKHVSGDELLEGMRELLMERFGPMTMLVLAYWGVQSTDDFGNIVFNLVSHKLLNKADEDTLEVFRNRYDFTEVFDKGYRQLLDKRISRMRAH